MKIAFVVIEFPKLSETFILNQVTGLLDRGHDVQIFARRRSQEPIVHSDVEKYKLLDRTHYVDIPSNKFMRLLGGIGLVFKNISKHPKIVLRSLNFLRYGKRAISLYPLYFTVPFSRNYDIIHCHFGPNGNWGATVKELGVQAKLVTTFHGYDIRMGIEKGGHIYDSLFYQGDCFVAISDFNRKHLINFGLDERKIVYLPVGIDIRNFPCKWNIKSSRDETGIRIVTVARLVEEKGLHYGIKAIYRVLKERPELDLNYTIIGSGPLREELEDLSKELGLSEIVHFVGPREQKYIIEMLGQSHIFLLPSIAEALPVSLMEAQAVGLPVVTTKVGDIENLVLDGKSGFVVAPGDTDALADKLKYIIDYPLKWPEMGLAGRKHVSLNYDINELNGRLEGIYQQLLN